jgi:ribose 5-phosphate isomerase A
MEMSSEELKKAAAEKAVEQVKSGMVLGLGTGSTTRYAITRIGELWQAGLLTEMMIVPTSEETAALAGRYGLPLTSLNEQASLDLAIDGADEVDPRLNLIKGLGGALLREKMVETAASRFIVVVDGSKLVSKLGSHAPLPVEVVQFGWKSQARWLSGLGCRPLLRGGEAQPFVTDNSNYILDCTFPNGIDDSAGLAVMLRSRAGVVEHGLFLGMASQVIVAEAGGVRIIP